MPRESTITYDQVAAICDNIKASGGKPNPRVIRDRHGSGSLGTIHRLFKQWESGQTRQMGTSLALPPQLQRAILDFMEQELAQARSTVEAQLVESQQEATDLAKENERQAEEVGELISTVERLQGEAQNRDGRLSVLEGELVIARREADEGRASAEAARTDLAKSQLRLEGLLRLETDMQSVRADLAAINKAREAAERSVAVTESQLEALESKLIEQKRHSENVLARSDAERKRMEEELIEARQQGRIAAAEIGKLQGELATLARAKAEKTAAAPTAKNTPKAKKATATKTGTK